MTYRLLMPRLLTLGALVVAACGEETTHPSSVDQPTAAQLALSSNTWLTRRDMPVDLVYPATAVVPNAAGVSVLYVMGGGSTGTPYGKPVPKGSVRAYNVRTNVWVRKRDMPALRYDMNAGVVNGKIYVPGGFTTDRQPTASLYVYDPTADTWSRKRDMPAPGGGGVTGVIGGKLYVITFNDLFNGQGGVANFFRYDPARDAWTRLPGPSGFTRVDPGGAGVIDKKLYVISGPGVLEYDPVTNRWTTRAAWSSEFCSAPCWLEGRTVPLLAQLYVVGAEVKVGGDPPGGIFIYDPRSDTWLKKPVLTQFAWYAPYGLTATRVFVDGQPRVEVVGGVRGWSNSPGNNQQYVP